MIRTRQLRLHRPLSVVFVLQGQEDIPDLGARVELSEPGGDSRTYTVHDFWRGEVGQVPAILCEMSMDPTCRTFSGLLISLAAEHGRLISPVEPAIAMVLQEIRSSLVLATKVPPT